MNDKRVWGFALIVVLALVVWYVLKTAKDKVVNTLKVKDALASLPEPRAEDLANATKIRGYLRGNFWNNDDEDAAVGVVKQYNNQTYPLLQAAYLDKYGDDGEDLNEVLEDELSASELAEIAAIIN